jgi:lipopolysaccharide export system permease protein
MKLSAIGANQKKNSVPVCGRKISRENGLSGEVIGSRFLNVKEITPERKLKGVVYEFDKRFQLSREVTAAVRNMPVTMSGVYPR